MTDIFLAALAIIGLTAFLSIIMIWVPSPDMIVVISIAIAMAAYDFARELFGKKKK